MDVLKDQTVVVLGGSSGIGLEVVRQAALGGARVIAVGRDRDKLGDALHAVPGNVRGIAADATDTQALDACFQETGPVDHLVLTLSGGEGAGTFAQLDLQALRRGFEAKFWPQVQAAQAALRLMRRGGSITFVTAASARIARAGVAGLGAINGALESMIGTLALELAPTRVNAVSPGVIDTPWWDGLPAAVKREVFDEQTRTLPAGRVGRADDVARTVLFLAESDFVTGTVVVCDGGLHLL
jgi:NAD(P)-dependent dehydrogenase (short-subunit alcohol dehydrogenase family)